MHTILEHLPHTRPGDRFITCMISSELLHNPRRKGTFLYTVYRWGD